MSPNKSNEITHSSFNAHDGPIRQMIKTNDGLLLTTSDESDPNIKVWDLNAIVNPNTSKKNSVMLIGVLKGHSNKIIGCEFLGGKNILSVDESGILNVFNLGVSQPIASQMISKANFKEVTFFSNKKQFAMLTDDNRIFIIQVAQVNTITTGKFKIPIYSGKRIYSVRLQI